LKSQEGWHVTASAPGAESYGFNVGGNDTIGFSALPRGCRSQFGSFTRYSEDGYWWSATEQDEDYVWVRSLYVVSKEIRKVIAWKKDGYSVRCLKD